jgi:DNA-binding response OmpR family regulator
LYRSRGHTTLSDPEKEIAVAEKFAGKSILVVDDDPDILTAITTGLSDTGADVQTARDGNSAVTMVESGEFDLVILDIMLPQKSGFLVLEKLRQGKPRSEGPKVVMITGNQGQRHRQYAEALGVDDYLNKPFRMERLLEVTEKLLAN